MRRGWVGDTVAFLNILRTIPISWMVLRWSDFLACTIVSQQPAKNYALGSPRERSATTPSMDGGRAAIS
jgi:hypothetical protein